MTQIKINLLMSYSLRFKVLIGFLFIPARKEHWRGGGGQGYTQHLSRTHGSSCCVSTLDAETRAAARDSCNYTRDVDRSGRIAIEWFRQVQGFDKTACAFGEKDGKGDSCENRKAWNTQKRPLNSHRLY